MPVSPPKQSVHGFTDWVAFFKATAWLGGTITFGLWAMLTWAMDDRYVKHEDLQGAVVEIKDTIQRSARLVQCEALLDDIQRLEQTITFKTRNGEDASLERTILDSDKRKLARYNGCPQ